MNRLQRPALLSIGAMLIATVAKADSLDGTYTASSLRVSWSIGDWGDDCGPRPSGGGEAGGTVTLTSSGAGFRLNGLGRSYSTSECWEQMPGLAARSRSTGSTAIQTTCTMPPGDPRRAKVTTSWFLKEDKILFDETGQYQFAVSKSTCTASVRRTRTLTRVRAKSSPAASSPVPSPPKGASPKTAQAKPATITNTKPPPPPERASACLRPGPAVSLEVTPKTKLMRPGERFQFSAIARDKNGCRSPVATRFELLAETTATVSETGVLSVPSDAQGGTLSIKASVGAQSVTVGARIVSNDEFEKLLSGGSYGTLGESLDAAEITLATGHVELAEAGPHVPPRKSFLIWVLGGLVLMAGLATLLLLHRMRRNRDAAARTWAKRRASDSARTEATPPAPPIPAPRASELDLKRLCPVCGKRYEEGTQFCTEDGARLMRAN